jgi:FdhD protein
MPSSPLGPVPGLGYSQSVSTHELMRLSETTSVADSAAIAEEVPVAFVYNAESFVVVMASPSDLEDLGVGFSVTEGIVDRAGDIERVDVVRHSRGVELQMSIPGTAFARLATRRRALDTRTGCGICGIEALDQVLREPPFVESTLTLSHEALWTAAAALDSMQPVNNETRSVHAAAFADGTGKLLVVREDVGRHNALDKVVGAILREQMDAAKGFLVVTSRASYELIQKTAIAGVSVLAAVSRPTSLAIRLADQAGITLVGLLRGRSANVYTHMERLNAD